jgi:uncharacterized membrane protein
VVDLTELASPANGAEHQPEAPNTTQHPASETEREGRTWADRGLWTAVGVGLLWWSWQLIGDSSAPWTVIFLVGGNLWGLLTIGAAWMPDNRWTTDRVLTNRLAWVTAGITIAIFVAWSVYQLTIGLVYGTDAIAFNQYAAQLVTHGLNPYTHSMAPAFQLFHTPTSYYTYSFTGRPVTTISYPTLSFLVYVPFLALGWTNNVAPWLNVFAWGLTVVMMFAMLPRNVRPVALLLGGYGLYVAFAIGGVTDALFMPLLTIAAYKWDRFGTSRWTYIGPVMFGLAMGIKQTPWPALPFLLLALILDEQARTSWRDGIIRAGKYLGVTVGVFLLPNIPWILASPSGWIKGVLTPLFADMVPTGQGTMSLSLYLHWGGGSLTAYTLAMVCTLLLLLVSFVGTYPVLRSIWFLLPAFAFFFAARSNVNYFISLIPAGLMAAVTISKAPSAVARLGHNGNGLTMSGRWFATGNWFSSTVSKLVRPEHGFRSPRWLLATAVCAFLFVVSVAYSLIAQPPFHVRVVSVRTTGTTNHIEALGLRVTNTSDKPIKPHFDLMQGGFNSTFWLISSGPKQVAPRSSADYTIVAPNSGAEPSTYGGFNVVGYLNNPQTFSVAPTYDPNLLNVGFDPQTIDTPMKLGTRIKLEAQIYSRDGNQVHRAGVLVRLGQVVWFRTGAKKAHAIINGGKLGKAAYATTNSDGVAEFTIVGVKAQQYPVTFSSTLYNKQYGYLYGSSGDLNIRFIPR